MPAYSIQVHHNPDISTLPEFDQPGFFFNEPAHIQQQTDLPVYVVTALNQRSGRTEARCAFFVDNDLAISPAAAPFGSVELVDTLPDSVLDTFLQTLLELAQSVCTTLRLVHYPVCYAPDQSRKLREKLLDFGFQITQINQTYYLPVVASSFVDNLVPAERRRLAKCQTSGFSFQHWPSPNIANVIRSILSIWQLNGYSLRIEPDKLINLLRQFPERFPVFAVCDGKNMAALAITIRVSSEILYVFLPATSPHYRRFSPMVMLVDGLYTYCQNQRINLLDLGTSLDGSGQPKPSLARFKKNLGAQESPKFVFEKQF